ncbi:hypothetical protein HYALB_00002099 [Hymenoscyphus albidus]|uniref:Trafficking protein particle complex subunit 10 n=1 Tax=Hymenoscyphus albidus TaxID=595503 RepID=A0A9N9LQ25_9HELO|nr:hypothetical protein HYALB_00002099 [Hymenoscyphus albidus]
MEQPFSSSKVTVEYFDPHGVYQLLSPGLLPRLPLRNLHWESHSGLLRSIGSLHIDLFSSTQDLRPNSSATEATTDSNLSLFRVKSEDSAASGEDGFRIQILGHVVGEKSDLPPGKEAPSKPATKERRHQIPGLRQTPYLKIFFLRCDDNETYKAQARREVREWIKVHIPPAQSSTKQNTQENHDAYEWLIVHVVVPNTAAATQPRTSGKSAEGNSGNAAEKAAARWRGGGSSTILEKLRADFNGSSKSAVDRIAQIRIGINDVPYDMLPRVVPAIPGSYTESAQENENSWIDLIAKLKYLILASFDMRVGQYEEDIREKDLQRTLPGWNFCTFFVLKEGLARGFESVGLVEDALVGYDELAVGLDAIVREQSTTDVTPQPGGSFLPFTEDLKRQAEKTRAAILRDMGEENMDTEDTIDLQKSSSDPVDGEFDEIPVNAFKKRYRHLILSNNISIFDFRCYIFARQLSLLLRLANAWSSQEELLAKLKEQRESSLQGVAARYPVSQLSNESEKLNVLAEVCSRSLDFVASITRVLRDDIWASQVEQGASTNGDEKKGDTSRFDPIMAQVVDNIASSFTFSVAQQILAQTSTKALPIPPTTLAPLGSKAGPDGLEPKAAIPEPKTMMHPARSSSLAVRSNSREPSGNRSASVPEHAVTASPFIKAGLEELAGHRAELYLLSRNVLEQVAKDHGWDTGWNTISELYRKAEMEDVDLGDDDSEKSDQVTIGKKLQPTIHGIHSKLLRTAIDNQDDFYRLYETLTDKALRHYTVAGYTHSVLSTMADLAIFKYHLKDYAAATSYFYQMTPSYGEGGWSQVEISMLVLYANCLKELQRNEEYVRVVLKLLSKSAIAEKAKQLRKSSLKIGNNQPFSDDEIVSTASYLGELLEITKSFKHEVTIPLQNFFGHVGVDGTPQYHSDRDSFTLQLRLRYLLEGDLPIEKAKVRINATFGDTHREIWLESKGPIVFKNGLGTLHVETTVIVPGTYTVGHVSLHTNNLILEYERTGSTPSKGDGFFKCPKILLYHRSEAFDLKLFASKYMHLDRNRSLELDLSTGWNDVIEGSLQIRAATAGLRVQTSEAMVVGSAMELSRKLEAGVIRFGSLAPHSTAKIRMPFNLEHDSSDVSLKIEVSYTTEKGKFFFAAIPTMSILLPLGVNVQDVFKHKALFSKFTISSATSSPLRLLSSKLEGSEVFEAKCGLPFSQPLTIFPRQPASMLYKITKLPPPKTGLRNDRKSALSLVLHYVCLEEEIESAITASLKNALSDTALYPYARLIIPTVVHEIQKSLSPYDLERIAVLNEITTSPIANATWRDYFLGLGYTADGKQDIATLLSDGLKSWQQENPTIPLNPLAMNEESVSSSRSIVIPVEVPPVTVVHTIDLKLATSTSIYSNTAIAVSNQPITASLGIKWTRQWDIDVDSEAEQTQDLVFYYEVSGSLDAWLIGGKRKGHFTVPGKQESSPKGQSLSFPIVLIPLKEGLLPFPNVDVKPSPISKVIRPDGTSGDVQSPRPKQTITCEADYQNAGEMIRVISDAVKTTVSLDASGPQGGAMLLECEGRGSLKEVTSG